MPKKPNTSWGKGAEWYDELVTKGDSYQQQVVLPNLLRVMEIKSGEKILDIGCGTGFFSAEFQKSGAEVVGVDIGKELIDVAKKNNPHINFQIADATNVPFVKNNSIDKAVFVLSLQNIADMRVAIEEATRTLKSGGKLFLVLNHPAFRIIGASGWGWDADKKVQYRRLDSYLSEKKSKIQMHPGSNPDDVTWSFHAPLQYFFKLFNKNGLLVERLEEWTSHTKTPHGPRAEAENRSRAEFPLFLAISAVKQ